MVEFKLLAKPGLEGISMHNDLDDADNAGKTPHSGSEEKSPITRRDVVKKAWVAPVFVAVNLPNGAFAKNAISPVATPAPTIAPSAPTIAPSAPVPAPSAPTP